MARVRLSGVPLGSPSASAPGPAPASVPPRSRASGGGLSRGLAGALGNLGQKGYLYLLIVLELGAIAGLRHTFRNHHGG